KWTSITCTGCPSSLTLLSMGNLLELKAATAVPTRRGGATRRAQEAHRQILSELVFSTGRDRRNVRFAPARQLGAMSCAHAVFGRHSRPYVWKISASSAGGGRAGRA